MIFLPQTNLNHHHITPSEVIQLRDRLKTELQRRCYFGDVSNLANNTGFSPNPISGQKTYVQQGKAVIDNFLAIEDFGDLVTVKENQPIPNAFTLDDMGAEITRLSGEKITGETAASHQLPGHTNKPIETSSCRGACTGLCVGNCAGNCNGCIGCSTGCQGCTGCSTTCSNDCYSGCQGCRGCNSGCSGSCRVQCTNCTGGCGGGCTGGCASGCTVGCTGGCVNGCTSCTGSQK